MFDITKHPYLHVAHATDLSGKERVLFRLFEILPAVLSWGTLGAVVLLALYAPMVAAYFIIAFDLYWLLKTLYLSVHQRHNLKRLRHNMSVDWGAMLAPLPHAHIYHMVLLPFYKEPEHIVREALESLLATTYDPTRIIPILASEERAGEEAQHILKKMEKEYAHRFGYFLTTTHPDGVAGEIRGKGPNMTYAAHQARTHLVEKYALNPAHIIVSAFDIDTVPAKEYFRCLSWHFLTTEDPHHASFQPVPLYNNNIWDAPAVSRVAAFSSTFWQMIQQERAEKLTTFSSHAISFKALEEVDFWQKNMVSDDSRIFWNLYFAHDGKYRTVPIGYPVSMDANLAETTWQTLVNIYKQHLRWSWGVENIPYMLYGFVKNKQIPFRQKLFHTFVQVEGFWSLATAPLIILLLGWLPLILGGEAFRDTVISYNLPYITRNLMIVAMVGLVLSAYIAFSLMPKLPQHKQKHRTFHYVTATFQWVLVPLSIIIFGAIPGLHAQAKLALGRYMGFWVTPKHRKS
jgi:cellulose synthase/poly-beta-1,6-N-acetylglucosamine synthase-like glycosyltransferase